MGRSGGAGTSTAPYTVRTSSRQIVHPSSVSTAAVAAPFQPSPQPSNPYPVNQLTGYGNTMTVQNSTNSHVGTSAATRKTSTNKTGRRTSASATTTSASTLTSNIAPGGPVQYIRFVCPFFGQLSVM